MHRVGFVIATIGRWENVQALLSDLDAAATAGLPVAAALVSQGGEPPAMVTDACSARGWPILVDVGRGASRARNIGVRALAIDGGHAVYANDHARYPLETLEALCQAVGQADVVVGRLVEQDVPRYEVLPSYGRLDPGNVWAAIEPATAISAALLDHLGGLDEQLGAGATPWGSSALGDLLLRISQRPHTATWLPAFVVHGPGARRAVDIASLNRKMRAYGRGYGFVLRRWDYPLLRRLGSVAKPPLSPHYRVGPDELPLQTRLHLALGRMEGILGRPIGRGRVRLLDDLKA